jgi:uncharacterized LabA/DUF88 family protein
MPAPNPLALNANDTTTAFIDGPSLYWAYKALDTESPIDMIKLKNLIEDHSRLQSIGYYAVFPPVERRGEDGHTPLKPLSDFLGYHGYRVYTKDAYLYQTDIGMRTKGSIEMELGLDAFNSAVNGVNHVLLFINDDNFVPLVRSIQERGTRVTVVSTETNDVVDNELTWAADSFIDLASIKDEIARRGRKPHGS